MIYHILGYTTFGSIFVVAAGAMRYLWIARTPIAASIHRLQVPDVDKDAVWQLSNSSDVGVV